MRRVYFIVFCLLLIFIDQLSKYFAEQHLQLGQPVEVIPSLFNFTLVYNPGAAFGLFADLPQTIRRVVLLAVSVLAFIVVYIMYQDTKEDPYSVFALGLIVAGAIGNLIDRLRYDAVVDFLDFYWQNYHWPAFNVADMCICIGVAILVLRMLFAHHSEPEKDSSQKTPG